VNLNEVLNLAKQLSSVDKVRLIQQIAFDLESQLRDQPTAASQHQPQQPPQQPPHPPQWDMSGEMGQRPTPSAPDIDPARWDDWASFPD
jgi:hypothetical protein